MPVHNPNWLSIGISGNISVSFYDQQVRAGPGPACLRVCTLSSSAAACTCCAG